MQQNIRHLNTHTVCTRTQFQIHSNTHFSTVSYGVQLVRCVVVRCTVFNQIFLHIHFMHHSVSISERMWNVKYATTAEWIIREQVKEWTWTRGEGKKKQKNHRTNEPSGEMENKNVAIEKYENGMMCWYWTQCNWNTFVLWLCCVDATKAIYWWWSGGVDVNENHSQLRICLSWELNTLLNEVIELWTAHTHTHS